MEFLMKVMVTGNMGYIGSVMTPMLRAEGHEAWGYDTGYFKDCLLEPDYSDGVSRQITKDIRAVEPQDLAGADAVIHLAALSNDPTGDLDPQLTEDINYKASVRLARAAKEAGVRRFIFASSCSIYGQSDASALTEEAAFNPQTAYARSKVDTEAALSDLADENFSPVYMRNATAYGFSPRLRFDLAVNNLSGWGYATGQVRLLSDGRAWRPMVHIEDITQACQVALRAPVERIHNQAFNVGAEEENYQIRDIAETVARVIPNCEVTFAEGASADNRTYNVSFAKIRRVLPEFKISWTVEKGIRQLYDAFQRIPMTKELFESKDFTRLRQLQYLIDQKRVNDALYWNGAS
jgi:nucleoside-diphosphate-sugar epimerase